MRTTITIDNDVLERARAISAKLRTPFKTVIRTNPHAMGLKPGRNMDNIQELLAQIEGEDSR